MYNTNLELHFITFLAIQRLFKISAQNEMQRVI